MLGNLIINHFTEQISIQNAIFTTINCSLNSRHQLSNLSPREALGFGGSFLDDIIIQSLDLNLLLLFLEEMGKQARLKRSSSPGKGNSKTSSIRSATAESRSLGRLVAKARTMSFDWSPVRNNSAFSALLWASLIYGEFTYSHKNASASSMKSNKPLLDFFAQSKSWCIFVTA
ncbi:amiloride-sensitive sodium channel subunit alpha [Striga asiatica]|uniref:Amiloride-sensitive sodium channel subunit alpha n=1 Tax=Striga asiatica TaxID=4170 RepID=A0A5A7QUM4_STRAF|nr:amiloride-sensitive sodium channel subunit alpha [Striga asiatica]